MRKGMELVLQTFLFVGCLLVLIFRWASPPINAQITCGGEPTLYEPSNPKSRAWKPNTAFDVLVFGPTSPAEFEQMRDGAFDWNSYSISNCSGVTFQNATLSETPYDQNAAVPNGAVWYYRFSNTQFRPEYRYIGGTQMWEIRAAKVSVVEPWNSNTPNWMRRISTHELGHGFGLQEETFPSVTGRSVMGIHMQITSCDTEAIKRVYCPATPTPTPSPSPNPTPVVIIGGCNGPPFPDGTCSSGFVSNGGTCTRSQAFMQQCMRFGDYDFDSCSCTGGCEGGGCSPIVVDVLGNGFDLTNAANGVNFDLDNNGVPERRGWTATTAVGSDDAWLALDRNGDGMIDNGRELFGNTTPQVPPPDGEEMHGFRALAMYDGPGYGGNGDGRITRHDAVFDRLRLWQDTNHNGVSESCELFTLEDLGLRRIDLGYLQSNRVDAHGNQFKYRARVGDAQDAQLGRWAWDVFLVVQQ